MSIQLSIFLYAYLAFLLLWAIFSITALYHMFKFGFKNFATYISVIIYIVISVIILGISYFYILQIDWNENLLDLDNSSSIDLEWE